MSEVRQNLWTAVAVVAACVYLGTLAEVAALAREHPPVGPAGHPVEPDAAQEPPSEADTPGGDQPAGRDDADLLADRMGRYCAAHEEFLAGLSGDGLGDDASADDVVEATLEALAELTDGLAAALSGGAGGEADPAVEELASAARRVADGSRRVLVDGDAGEREAFLLAQLDDLSYLQPIAEDDALHAAARATPACAELPFAAIEAERSRSSPPDG